MPTQIPCRDVQRVRGNNNLSAYNLLSSAHNNSFVSRDWGFYFGTRYRHVAGTDKKIIDQQHRQVVYCDE